MNGKAEIAIEMTVELEAENEKLRARIEANERLVRRLEERYLQKAAPDTDAEMGGKTLSKRKKLEKAILTFLQERSSEGFVAWELAETLKEDKAKVRTALYNLNRRKEISHRDTNKKKPKGGRGSDPKLEYYCIRRQPILVDEEEPQGRRIRM